MCGSGPVTRVTRACLGGDAMLSRPGVVLPRTGEGANKEMSIPPAFNATFPVRTTQLYETPRLVKLDLNETCEASGWPVEFYRQFLT